MNKKIVYMANLILLVIGVFAIISAIYLWYLGEYMRTWIGAIIIAVSLIISGYAGLKILKVKS